MNKTPTPGFASDLKQDQMLSFEGTHTARNIARQEAQQKRECASMSMCNEKKFAHQCDSDANQIRLQKY
jgi:hypothetical protein